jgi:hypothetical protein
MKKQSQASIGRSLGLSASSMTKLKGMGMPVDSVQNARAWRDCNIAPTMHTSALRRTIQQTPINSKPSDAFANAQSFMSMAASDLVDGKCIDTLIPHLRSALAAVPGAERDALLVSPEVMDVLVDSVANCLPCDSGDSRDGNKPMSDADAQYMGRFWYQVAAGEIRPT